MLLYGASLAEQGPGYRGSTEGRSAGKTAGLQHRQYLPFLPPQKQYSLLYSREYDEYCALQAVAGLAFEIGQEPLLFAPHFLGATLEDLPEKPLETSQIDWDPTLLMNLAQDRFSMWTIADESSAYLSLIHI